MGVLKNEKVFPDKPSVKVYSGVKVFLKECFCKITLRYFASFSAKLLKKFLRILRCAMKRYREMFWKQYCKVFCKTNEVSFAKILKTC